MKGKPWTVDEEKQLRVLLQEKIEAKIIYYEKLKDGIKVEYTF